MSLEQLDQVDETCDCAPTPAERRALWPKAVNRRTAISLGALGLAGTALLAAPALPAAFAVSYPSWDDVQRAKKNQANASAEVVRIQGLIQTLTQNVATTQALADQRADELFAAEEAYYDAAARATDLQSQADAQAAIAKESADKAGRLAAQLYRDGGDDTSLELFFSGSADGADDLLARLGTMDKLLDRNQDVYAAAVTARDTAQLLSDQAEVARVERDRLKKIAEDKLVEAQAAADAAQAALDAQEAHLEDLQAQLAALQDTTAKTVAAYKVGVEVRRKAKAERLRREREAAEKAAQAGGGGGGGGGGSSNGWVRPNHGHISFGFGPRKLMCGPDYCGSTNHRGVDFAGGCGSPIYAAHSGRVTMAQNYSGYGNYVRIAHSKRYGTGYGHIKPGGFRVRRGDRVRAGDVIAYAGNTGNSFGCHLHFEVYDHGNTINPQTFLRRQGVNI